MGAKLGMKVVDFKAINEEVKASLGTEEEPFEGEMAPTPDIEKAAAAIIASAAGGKRQKFLLDGYNLIYKTPEDLMAFTSTFGVPEFVLDLTASQANIDARWATKNEKDAIDEEGDRPVLDDLKKEDEAMRTPFIQKIQMDAGDRCKVISLSTDDSLETTTGKLKAAFQPKIILLNHEKRLGTDTACANLAIKYNLIYISVYQLIKEHVEGKSEWGKKLALTKRNLKLNVQMQMRDEFAEQDYSAALYDYRLVMELLKETIATKRTDQTFVLIEGLFNAPKLDDPDVALENRLMDEFQAVERELGEVAAIVGLQLAVEPEGISEENIDFVKAVPADPNEAQPVAAEGEGEEGAEGGPPKPKWRAEDYDWSLTDRKPKNLPQVFLCSKGAAKCRHEVKASDAYSSSSYEAISKALDEFCALTRKEANGDGMYLYTQVLFSD